MPRDPLVYLEDIKTACDRIAEYVAGIDFDDFARSPMTIDAVIRNLEIIGEAAKNIREDIRAAAPDIEWRRIAALRDVLAHEYFSVKLETVWDVVQTKVPTLRRDIARILNP